MLVKKRGLGFIFPVSSLSKIAIWFLSGEKEKKNHLPANSIRKKGA